MQSLNILSTQPLPRSPILALHCTALHSPHLLPAPLNGIHKAHTSTHPHTRSPVLSLPRHVTTSSCHHPIRLRSHSTAHPPTHPPARLSCSNNTIQHITTRPTPTPPCRTAPSSWVCVRHVYCSTSAEVSVENGKEARARERGARWYV